MALQIRQPNRFRQRLNAQQYQQLTHLLDGQHTLRDLALQLQRDLVAVTRSLLPYLQQEAVAFVHLPDLPPPLSPSVAETAAAAENFQPPLIACVDDSPMMRYLLQTTIEAANYRFLGFSNPLQAISRLPDCQPDLLLLDLIMPELDGYEVCRQLRQMPSFQQIPIIFCSAGDRRR